MGRAGAPALARRSREEGIATNMAKKPDITKSSGDRIIIRGGKIKETNELPKSPKPPK